MKNFFVIVLESLLLFSITFILSVGHIVIANAYSIPWLSLYFVIGYGLSCWSAHRACGLHQRPSGWIVSIIVCVVAFVAVECLIHKDEKGCQDWIVKLIEVIKK